MILLGVMSGVERIFWTGLPLDHLPVDVISAQGSPLDAFSAPTYVGGASVRCRGDDLDVLRYVGDIAGKATLSRRRSNVLTMCSLKYQISKLQPGNNLVQVCGGALL
jgi:hypothetical protein